jgi:peptide/nickel transport system permease protein
MTGYLLRQLGSFLVTFVLVLTLVFLAVRALPGDAAQLRVGTEAGPEATRAIRRSLGLDRPLLAQYAAWWGDLARGDLGSSFRESRPVADVLAERIPITLALAGGAFALSLVAGLALGLAAGLRPGGAIDRAVLAVTTLGLALPEFWIGFLLLLAFAVQWPVLPLIGLPEEGGLVPWLRHLALPAVTLALPRAAQLARLARATLLEHRGSDWLRAVRAKGVGQPGQARHLGAVSFPALLPVVALELGGLLTGTIVVEQVFGLPGLGLTLIGSIGARDLPVVQGVTVIAVVVYVLVNTLADVSQAWADPRIRHA